MPLVQSPSKKAFQHNVEVEMKAHPENRSQNLAIAYAIKRRNKKMAEGGMVPKEDMAREHDQIEHLQPDNNMDLHPGKPSGPMTQDIDHERLSMEEQEDGELPQPMEPSRHVMPGQKGTRQDWVASDFAGYAKGGMVHKALMRRMAMGGYAEGGRVEDGDSIDNKDFAEHPDNDFLSAEEQTPYHHLGEHDEMDPRKQRRGVIRSIMRNLQAKNMGK